MAELRRLRIAADKGSDRAAFIFAKDLADLCFIVAGAGGVWKPLLRLLDFDGSQTDDGLVEWAVLADGDSSEAVLILSDAMSYPRPSAVILDVSLSDVTLQALIHYFSRVARSGDNGLLADRAAFNLFFIYSSTIFRSEPDMRLAGSWSRRAMTSSDPLVRAAHATFVMAAADTNMQRL